ncbi:MAG: hypothetical protein HOZ81_00280 [Streptomyces sp.]|nr:hypothetical protein [Streptomyces sp.]NUT25201.1 hypothetical protein [Streptomyces sp.]
MSQPPFQPPQQPPQPPQQPPNAYNPYNQPTPPQQPPGFGPASHAPGQPPMPAGPPPAPGQPPMQPMYPAPPFQGMPYGHQPNASGHPVGAVFLALFVSLIISMLYSGLILLTYKDMTVTVANTMYLGHALINGAVVGALIGAVGHRSHGAWIWGAVIAALGAFFGYTNAFPLVIADAQSPAAIGDMMEADPFIPAKAWWNDETGGGVDWFSPLGLVLAAVAAWGLAYLIGNRRRQR